MNKLTREYKQWSIKEVVDKYIENRKPLQKPKEKKKRDACVWYGMKTHNKEQNYLNNCKQLCDGHKKTCEFYISTMEVIKKNYRKAYRI